MVNYWSLMKQIYNLPCVNEYGEVVMSLLTETVLLKGAKGTEEVVALFDSGASYSCIRADIALNIGTPEILEEPISIMKNPMAVK